MLTLLSTLGSLLSFRVRGRLTQELELVALRHQVAVLRRQRPGQPSFFCTIATSGARPELFAVTEPMPP